MKHRVRTYLQYASLACAIALTLALLAASVMPASGQVFKSGSHWVAHFASFAILGLTWRCGLPRMSAMPIAAAVIAFAFLHEAIEIVGHGHAYELADAIIDAIGAAVGVLLASITSKRGGSGQSA